MTWNVVETAVRQAGGEHLLEALAPPATRAALAMVEEELGAPLPAAVRRHLTEHDGAPDLLPSPMLIGTGMIPLVHRELVELGELEERDFRHLVPVAWDEQPPYICVDPSRGDRVVEVEETGEEEEVAPSLDLWLESVGERIAGEDRDFCISREGMHWLEGWDYYRVEGWDGAEGEALSARGPRARIVSSTRFHDDPPSLADVVVAETYHGHAERLVAFAYVHEPAQERLAALEPALQRWRDAGFDLPPASVSMLLAVPFRDDGMDAAEVAAQAFAEAHPVLRARWVPVRARGAFEGLTAFCAEHGVPLPPVDLDALVAEARRVGSAAEVGPGEWLAGAMLAQVNGALAAAGDARRFGRVVDADHPLADAWVLVTEAQRRALTALLPLAFEP